VSKVLRLEFNHLKRMAESSERIAPKRRAATPAFLGLIVPQAVAGALRSGLDFGTLAADASRVVPQGQTS
jgi:hypothetical protein